MHKGQRSLIKIFSHCTPTPFGKDTCIASKLDPYSHRIQASQKPADCPDRDWQTGGQMPKSMTIPLQPGYKWGVKITCMILSHFYSVDLNCS